MATTLPPPERRRAPWSDFAGAPIFEGDTILHPDGTQGVVVYLPDQTYDGDAWRVRYVVDPSNLSRLGLQIGNKGRAVVVRGANSDSLDAGSLDTLVALVEVGPLWDGDLPSKAGRDKLVERGLAVRVVVRGADGWQAATYSGRDFYKRQYGGDTLYEAIANRHSGAGLEP